MNRKTNIFYNADTEDTRFITFNNYSEALTGDILATDYKLWPSRFICLYIDELDIKNLTISGEDTIENRQIQYNENKQKLIDLLEQYYENKLTVLRDNLDTHDNLKPLNYLIDVLYYFIYNLKTEVDENKIQNLFDIENKLFNNDLFDEEKHVKDLIDFNYISDIVEQQYNGTYADIICTINPHKWEKPIIQYVNTENTLNYVEQENSIIQITNENFLYGWNNVTDNSDSNSNQHKLYSKVHNKQIPDNSTIIEESEVNVYYLNSLIDNIKVESENSGSTKLKFNVLIPLFNCVNTVNEHDIDENSNVIKLNNNVNVPLGIYFTGDTIELNIDNKYATNWSVLISTQFSAFPFSFNIQQNFDDSQTTKQAFLTYAEILASQSNIYTSFDKYDAIIKTLQNRIMLLESKINNISSVQNIDDLAKAIADLKSKQEKMQKDFNEQISNVNKLIDEARIKWHITTRS